MSYSYITINYPMRHRHGYSCCNLLFSFIIIFLKINPFDQNTNICIASHTLNNLQYYV